MLDTMYNKFLKQKGVKLPKKGTWGRKTLEYLFHHIGTWQNKETIIKKIKYTGNDLQAPRQLKLQGWWIEQDYNGNYKLASVQKAFPNWKKNARKSNLNFKSWETLKNHYGFRCAQCGCKEGEKHRYTNKVVKLEKGHKNPDLPLDLKNTIPHCNYCNRRAKDKFKFDEYGWPIAIKKDKKTWIKIPNYHRV